MGFGVKKKHITPFFNIDIIQIYEKTKFVHSSRIYLFYFEIYLFHCEMYCLFYFEICFFSF